MLRAAGGNAAIFLVPAAEFSRESRFLLRTNPVGGTLTNRVGPELFERAVFYYTSRGQE
jgi:hypothetical protein